jgi:hypothetical protein
MNPPKPEVVVNKNEEEFTEEEKQRIEQALAASQQKNQVHLVVRTKFVPFSCQLFNSNAKCYTDWREGSDQVDR